MLDRLIAVIISSVNPRKIILFGSMATGSQHDDSDVDLIVLIEDGVTSTSEIAARLYRETAGLLSAPLDILVERENEFYARGELPTMERRILREGTVMYAA